MANRLRPRSWKTSQRSLPAEKSKIKHRNPKRLHRNVQRFRGGLVLKAHRRWYHSTLGLRVIKKKKKTINGKPLPAGILENKGFWTRHPYSVGGFGRDAYTQCEVRTRHT